MGDISWHGGSNIVKLLAQLVPIAPGMGGGPSCAASWKALLFAGHPLFADAPCAQIIYTHIARDFLFIAGDCCSAKYASLPRTMVDLKYIRCFCPFEQLPPPQCLLIADRNYRPLPCTPILPTSICSSVFPLSSGTTSHTIATEARDTTPKIKYVPSSPARI